MELASGRKWWFSEDSGRGSLPRRIIREVAVSAANMASRRNETRGSAPILTLSTGSVIENFLLPPRVYLELDDR